MTEQLEAEVRAALHERAAQVPAARIARLTHTDYHPRTRRLGPPRRVRPPLAIGALTTAAGTAGAVAVIVSLTAGASNAFAGWTAKPTPPTPGQLAGARASCETSQSPISGLPLKLADTRGPYTFAIYADSNSSAACIKGPSFVAVSASVASSAVNVAAGRTGAGVSGVTLTLDDGTNVQATVGAGCFVAWWPSGHPIKSAELTTPTGIVTQTFNLTPEIPCHLAPRCSSSVSDVGGGGPAAGGGTSVSGFASGGGEVQSGSVQSSSRSR